MKKCRRCGARNRDKYTDCLRCGEPLASAGAGKTRTGGVPPAIKLAVAMFGLLAVMIAGFRFMAGGQTASGNQAVRSPSLDSDDISTEDVDLLSVEESLGTEEGDEALNEAALATRNGKEAYRAGDFEAALGYFEELAQLSPNNYSAFLFAGMCQQKLGDLEGAKTSLRTALELKPNEELTRKALIKLLVDANEIGEAATLQNWFVEQRRFDPAPLLELARMHRRLGDHDAALEELRHAVEISSDPAVPIELGTALAEANRTQDAVTVFEEVIESNPGDARAHAGLGAAYLRGQQYERALGPLEKAVQLDPNAPRARLNLAVTYENIDRIEDSLREYEEFVRLAPNDPSANRISELVERAKAALAERQAN